MTEKRIPASKKQKQKPVSLPVDYLKMIQEVLAQNFEEGLTAFAKLKKNPKFKASGAIYPDEVLLTVSLVSEGDLAATTIHASADFDPKASSPKAEELLASCLDGIGALFNHFFDPEKPELLKDLASSSLSEMKDIPFHWSEFPINKRSIYLKVDKSNALIDELTDEWLDKNDPALKAESEKEHEESENLFVTGKPKDIIDDDDGSTH